MPAYSPSNDESLESQLIQLTRDLVLIESTDAKPEERRRCFQLVRNHLDELPNLNLKPYENFGYESLLALPAGVDIPTILFCAHLDVVEHLGPEYYRSRLSDGRIHGPGAGDMKGALAIVLTLFHHLRSEKPNLPIGLAVTSDEEQGGEHGARFLVEECGLRAGAVIIPDGGSIDKITVEEKGILHLVLSFQGESAHAARPWLGQNPIQELMQALQTLQVRISQLEPGQAPDNQVDDNAHWYPTCSVTRVSTPNESVNRIPDEANAVLDIRFPPPHSTETMMKLVRETLGPSVEIELIIGAEPTHLAPDKAFLGATKEIIGTDPHLVCVSGGSDARFFRQHNIPVMLSRPIVGNLHGHDEWIDVRSMIDYYRICERYVKSSLH